MVDIGCCEKWRIVGDKGWWMVAVTMTGIIIAIIAFIVIICFNAFADLLLNGIEMKENLPCEDEVTDQRKTRRFSG